MNGRAEILQIIPADGWYAEFRVEDEDRRFRIPLVCWTLLKDEDGDTFIGGVDADGIGFGDSNVMDDENFVGFTRYAGGS